MNDTIAIDRRAIDKLVFPQGGKYLYGALAGPSNSRKRRDVMSILIGRKALAAESGLTALMSKLEQACGTVGETPHDREHDVLQWIIEGRIAA